MRRRLDWSQDAEDLVAGTFLKATATIEGFAWRLRLFRIAHNPDLNFQRRR